MLIFGHEIFLDHILKLLHHRGGREKLPVVTNGAGVAVLGKRFESREFPHGKPPVLCKSYVIIGHRCSVHEMNVHLS